MRGVRSTLPSWVAWPGGEDNGGHTARSEVSEGDELDSDMSRITLRNQAPPGAAGAAVPRAGRVWEGEGEDDGEEESMLIAMKYLGDPSFR